MTPVVSIVTTVFDRVACLHRCLRSVDRLELPGVEHIIVSDAPPAPVVDEIAAIVAAAGGPAAKRRYLNLPERRQDWGLSPALAGLESARGEYVCFLSDDNAYLPDHFGPLVAALDADPGLGFAYSSCLYAGRKELRYAPPQGARIDLGQPLFRRSALSAADLDACRGSFAWDWEVIQRLMLRGVRWQHVDRTTFVFRLEAYPHLVEALA